MLNISGAVLLMGIVRRDMPTYPLRVRFSSADVAYDRFHSFPPADVDWIESTSRKRDGDSQVMLLRVVSREHLQDFLELCKQHRDITDVVPISEDEYWRASSNAI
jgi:hypothetical protein